VGCVGFPFFIKPTIIKQDERVYCAGKASTLPEMKLMSLIALREFSASLASMRRDETRECQYGQEEFFHDSPGLEGKSTIYFALKRYF
jgi:hypothetical protein